MADRYLHITHGEAANERLADSELPGDLLAWDDVLHEGPVPEALDLDALSSIRARYISEQGWSSVDDARIRFEQRNRLLRTRAEEGDVIIWTTFELFDQLHLWQILDWFERRQTLASAPFVIWLSGYFSEQPRAELRNWFLARERCDPEYVTAGSDLWQRFRAPDPRGLEKRYRGPGSHLPFETQAVGRLLEEFPSAGGGISRTQRQVLEVLADGPLEPAELFRRNQALEAPAFMGDWSFWSVLAGMMNVPAPAVVETRNRSFVHPPAVNPDDDRFRDQVLQLTDFGMAILAGQADFIERNGIDRWIGGVHLRPDNAWRWDGERFVVP